MGRVKKKRRAREMAQQLRAFLLVEEPGLIPSAAGRCIVNKYKT